MFSRSPPHWRNSCLSARPSGSCSKTCLGEEERLWKHSCPGGVPPWADGRNETLLRHLLREATLPVSGVLSGDVRAWFKVSYLDCVQGVTHKHADSSWGREQSVAQGIEEFLWQDRRQWVYRGGGTAALDQARAMLTAVPV